MASSQTVTFKLGETWPIVITCYDASGNILNLTGANVRFRVASASALLLDLSSTGGTVLVPTPANGVAQVSITPTQQTTAGFDPATIYTYEFQAVLSDGTVTDQANGLFYVQPSLFEQFP